jgi:aconitate hydratase
VPLAELLGTPVDQVAVGSCTNSSYQDLMTVARLLEGRITHPRVSLVVSPGSRQVYDMVARNGALATLLESGARMLESACGPCPGIGAVPASGSVSLRSFNRNFPGRCGSMDAFVYLASPAVCAAAAVAGEIVDPRTLAEPKRFRAPRAFRVDDRMIEPPAANPEAVEIRRGPNIKPIVTRGPLEDPLRGEVLIRLGDNVSTDQILPAMAHVLPLRSNLPAISEYVFSTTDRTFVERARARGGGVIVAARNYGQGSSREHAALAPMYLGITAVLAISFARIHLANLVNFGIAPLAFADEADYARFEQGDVVEIVGIRAALERGDAEIEVRNHSRALTARARLELGARARRTLLAGGLLNSVRWAAPAAQAVAPA